MTETFLNFTTKTKIYKGHIIFYGGTFSTNVVTQYTVFVVYRFYHYGVIPLYINSYNPTEGSSSLYVSIIITKSKCISEGKNIKS